MPELAGSLQRHALPVIADIRSMAPLVYAATLSCAPGLPRVLDGIIEGVPVLQRFLPHRKSRFYRLPRHWRSVCCAIDPRSPFDSAVVVLKGTEPLSGRFPELIDWIGSSRPGMDVSWHLLEVEGKVPGGVTLAEAMAEFEAGRLLQERHLAHYGALAAAPVPLFVMRLPAAMVLRAHAVIARGRGHETVRALQDFMANGLACLVSYYPDMPLRAESFAAADGRALARRRLHAYDVSTTIDGWLLLFVRILWLGWLPATPQRRHLGACLNRQNATMGGGFNDLGSLVAIDQGTSPLLVEEAVAFSLDCLFDSIASALEGAAADGAPWSPGQTLFFDRIDQLLESEEMAGRQLHPVIRSVLAQRRRQDAARIFTARPRCAIDGPCDA